MRESLKSKRERALAIADILDRTYEDAGCSLDFEDALQLLVAIQLAAQCTDERVNMVTKSLFKKYRTVYDYASARQEELEEDIKSTGFFRNKARNIIACCQMLIDKYNGQVPDSMEELLQLPGVGRKTANVILGVYYNKPGIIVDTHARRLSRRLGLTRETDPDKIEFDLMKILPEERWTRFSHCLVFHGRACCTARNPRCHECPVRALCPRIM